MSKSAATNSSKGKGRAHDDDDDEDLRMSGDEQQPTHKNGNGAGAPQDDEEEDDHEEDAADLSEGEKQRRQEEKDRGERKRVRSMYRKLQSRVDDARGDLQNTTVDSLTDQVANANALFDKVDRPSEAILDSRVLIATSEAGALKARQLKIDGDAFDTDEFLVRLVRFMGGRGRSARSMRRKRTRRGGAAAAGRKGTAAAADDSDAQSESEDEDDDEEDDDDDDDRPMKYGPLAIEVKEKKARTQRAKNQWEAEQVRPEELRAEDVAKNENETGKVTARIAKRLREVGGNTGLPYLKFVVNPTSFSQTTENLFYFSFLVREQKAAVEVDEDPDSPFFGDMICFAVDAEALDGANAAAAPPPKNQVVLELTEQIWRDAIDLYGLEGEESIIPTREAFVPPVATGKYKWTGSLARSGTRRRSFSSPLQVDDSVGRSLARLVSSPTRPSRTGDLENSAQTAPSEIIPTFALAASPLSTSSATSLRLAVGSYSETRVPTASSSSANSSANYTNHLTVAAVDPAVADLEDDSDSESETAYRSRSTRQRVLHPSSGSGGGGAFRAVARTPLLYPPSAVQFAPARLSGSLASGTGGNAGYGEPEQREVLATSSESLRLWDLVTEQDDGGGRVGSGGGNGFVGGGSGGHSSSRSRLVSRATLQNSKAEFSAPLTGFSWSMLEPTQIVTASIDTTCTVWDISTGVPVTQLIAHDREVYDVAWSPAQREIFASVGADGSVRMFDLRSLEHSTILYEAAPSPSVPATSSTTTTTSSGSGGGGGSSGNSSAGTTTAGGKEASGAGGASSPSRKKTGGGGSSSASSSNNGGGPPAPLLRLAFSPTSPNYLAVVHADSPHVQILDTRSPGTAALEVRGHKAPVNGIAWGAGGTGATMSGASGGGGNGPGWLSTVSDDATLLMWDLSQAQPPAPPTTTSSASSSSASRSTAAAAQQQQPKPITTPAMAYTAPSEVNAVAWGGGGGEWISIGCGRLVRTLRI
ncbi:hypothetical protein C6P46_004852 [Rhodotorula mucilaginosa]|uniref:Uncharacterized protein n=1 Tax=Rhodotorula mucilaginosa TaxID=5537 RepID=A0A9P6VYZ4_RHOMI|nr:hypothetical protein C6P46_004852 [Rhodotorula mucilaginosa]